MGGKRRAHGEGTITKRADGRWEAKVTLPDGRRKSLYAKTQTEARTKLTAALRDLDRGLPLARDDRQTVAQYLGAWLDMVRPAVKPKTFALYEMLTRYHIVPAIGTITLTKLSPAHIQRLWSVKLEEGLSPTTVRHLHSVLHNALARAVRLGLIQRNVTELVEPPRASTREMRPLSPAEVEQFLTAASGDRLEALYVLAVTTGMREGELLALRWRHVDLDAGMLHVVATLYKKPYSDEWIFGEPKTKSSRRKIRLTRQALAALVEHRARQRIERISSGPTWQQLDLVFCTRHGTPFDRSNLLTHEFYPLLARAGLPQIRFHDLRHTAATLLLARHIPTKVIAELLGHSSPALTESVYAHVTQDMQEAAVQAMEEAIDSTGDRAMRNPLDSVR